MTPEALDWTKLLGGLGLLLFGIHYSEQVLTSVSLPSLRNLIHRFVPNRFAGVGAGLGITLFTQSSSATTVLLTNLMGMQMMTLTVAVAVTLGAAIGSTFSVQLLALRFTAYGPLFLAVGLAITKLVSKYRSGWQLTGGMTISLGLIFMGLQYMVESTAGLRSDPLFTSLLDQLANSYFYGFMAGLLFTALIHSSAATVAIVMGLVTVLPVAAGAHGAGPAVAPPDLVKMLPIVLGANVGTTATALMAAVGGAPEAKQLAFGNFFTKLVPALLVLPCLDSLNRTGLFHYSGLGLTDAPTRVAAFHVLFNVGLTVAWLPFLDWNSKLCQSVFPHLPGPDAAFKQRFLDEESLQVPEVALGQVRREINRMTGRLELMLTEFWNAFAEADPAKLDLLKGEDDRIDRLYADIHPYLTTLNGRQLGPLLANRVLRMHYIATYLEHAGDIVSSNMARFVTKRIQEFPETQATEFEAVHAIHRQVEKAFKYLATVLGTGDRQLLDDLSAGHTEMLATFDSYFSEAMKTIGTSEEATALATLSMDLVEEYSRFYDYTIKIAALLQAEADESLHPPVAVTKGTPAAAKPA